MESLAALGLGIIIGRARHHLPAAGPEDAIVGRLRAAGIRGRLGCGKVEIGEFNLLPGSTHDRARVGRRVTHLRRTRIGACFSALIFIEDAVHVVPPFVDEGVEEGATMVRIGDRRGAENGVAHVNRAAPFAITVDAGARLDFVGAPADVGAIRETAIVIDGDGAEFVCAVGGFVERICEELEKLHVGLAVRFTGGGFVQRDGEVDQSGVVIGRGGRRRRLYDDRVGFGVGKLLYLLVAKRTLIARRSSRKPNQASRPFSARPIPRPLPPLRSGGSLLVCTTLPSI